MTSLIAALKGSLIVSCQAPDHSPLRDAGTMKRIAQAVLQVGAAGIRANSPDDVRAIRAITDRPIIGLHKVPGENRAIITPTLALAAALVEAGADIVALDVTREAHSDPTGIIRQVHSELGCPVMADASTLEEGLAAWEAGADMVGTTLSGYTSYNRATQLAPPDLQLVEQLASRGVCTIAEGRFVDPVDVRRALELGAHAVVVGGAITDPLAITRRFLVEIREGHSAHEEITSPSTGVIR